MEYDCLFVLKDTIKFVDRDKSIGTTPKTIYAISTMLALCSPEERKEIWRRLSKNRRLMAGIPFEDENDYIEYMNEKNASIM